MKPENLSENFKAFFQAVMGEVSKFGSNNIKRIKVSPTMGPSIDIDVNSIN
jgi:ribosomal protein L1